MLLLTGCSKKLSINRCKEYCSNANGYSVSATDGICSCIYNNERCIIEQ